MPEEANEVAQAVRDVLAGRSLGSVIRSMNARGITTRTGRPFTYATLRQMLLRPRNAGLTCWNDEILGNSDFPPIVSREEWEAVRRVLTDPARRKSQSTRVKHLLSGLAVCAVCGQPMKSASASNRDGTKRTVYRCKSVQAGHPVRNAAALDQLVAEVAVARLSQSDAAIVFASNDSVDMDALRGESIALQQRLDDATEQCAEGGISAGQLATISARIHDKLAAVSEAMAEAQSSPAVGAMLASGNVQEAWDAADIETRRAVVTALMSVEVLAMGKAHGKTFDPRSVRILPRVPQNT
ncbi:recombinase family protein [Kocuria sp. CPCC 205263]|uniref:recombinase family protein n=1 Tax=Kocuria sp. CPCC 205263 TaxID=3073555 RepID=UPI0034D742AC